MIPKGVLTHEASTSEDLFEEDWLVVLSNSAEYHLSKNQARVLQQTIATGNRGIVTFQTFSISIPYIVEFYRERKYRKDTLALPEKAQEAPFEPVPNEKWKTFMAEIRKKSKKYDAYRQAKEVFQE